MKKNNNQPKKYPSNNTKTKEKTLPINLYKKNGSIKKIAQYLIFLK